MRTSKPLSTEEGYAYGFTSEIAQEVFVPGLTEEVIRAISQEKQEPEWLLTWRLKAFTQWQRMSEPTWANLTYTPIDYQSISYFAKPKRLNLTSLDEVDPEILETFNRLGIPLDEQKMLTGVAVDAVLDSVSVRTTFQDKLAELGIIFCAFSEAVKNHPKLVQTYLGSVVPATDNFFACLNSAVFSDGTFVYIPPNTRCPMELSTYFRLNAANVGQFERTLIICDKHGYMSYLEGCTAPFRSENQLHAAVVELVALESAEIRYSTVQNWYPGDKDGRGGVYNFVTKRGICKEDKARISWVQVETGSAITWKYPSVILKGDYSVGEFYSLAITRHKQQADTGTKMTHLGKHTKSRIISKGISADTSSNTYRGQVYITEGADRAKNVTQCDSLLLGSLSKAYTFPTIKTHNSTSTAEHEASSSKLSEEAKLYIQTRGLTPEQASQLIIQGFCRDIVSRLPFEFALEARQLIELNLEGTVG